MTRKKFLQTSLGLLGLPFLVGCETTKSGYDNPLFKLKNLGNRSLKKLEYELIRENGDPHFPNRVFLTYKCKENGKTWQFNVSKDKYLGKV